MDEDQLLDWANEAVPLEACGLVFGDEVIRITNMSVDPGHFDMAYEEMLDVINERGAMPDAVWHSHPNGRPEPSEKDWQYHPKWCRMIIVTLTGVYDHGYGP